MNARQGKISSPPSGSDTSIRRSSRSLSASVPSARSSSRNFSNVYRIDVKKSTPVRLGDLFEIYCVECQTVHVRRDNTLECRFGEFQGAYKTILEQRMEEISKTMAESIKSGIQVVKTVDDAIALYQANSDDSYIYNAPFEPTGETFVWSGPVVLKDEDEFLVFDDGTSGVALTIQVGLTPSIKPSMFSFKQVVHNFAHITQEGRVTIVGKYTYNNTYGVMISPGLTDSIYFLNLAKSGGLLSKKA